MRKLSTLIAFIKSDYDRQNFYHELVSITGLPLENEKQAKKEYNIMRQQPQMKKETLDGLTKAEYTIIKQTMTSKKALDKFRRELGCLYSEECERLIEEIIDDYRRYGDIDPSRLLDEISDESIKDLLIKIEMTEEIGSEYKEDIFEGAILKVKETIKKARLEDLKIKIKETSGAKMSEYLREYTDLIKELGGKRNGR